MNSRLVWWLVIFLGLPRLAWPQATLSDKYRQKAEAFYAEGDYDEARHWYEKAYSLVCRNDPVRAANLCVDLSSLDYRENHTRTATDRCLLGLRHINTLKTSPDSVSFKLFSSLGTFYIAQYRKDSARYYFRKADDLLTHNPRIEADIPLYVLYHYNNQGSWFFELGNYIRSLVFLRKAQEIAQTYGPQGEMAYIESNLAGCYNAIGNFEEALTHIVRAANMPTAKDSQTWRYTLGTGWTLYNLKRYSEALSYLAKAEQQLTALRRKPSSYVLDQIMLWRMMSSCYRAAKQPVKAERYAEQAIQLHRRRVGNRGASFAQALVEKGENYEHRQAVEQALSVYQAAIRAVCPDTAKLTNYWQNPAVENASDETILLLAAVHKAVALKKQYETTRNPDYLRASVATYRFCVGLEQRIRHGIDTDQSQVFFSERQHTLVPDALASTFEAYQRRRSSTLRELLFRLFEQAQSGSLREAFQQNAIKPQTIPGPLLEREQRLKEQISALKKRALSDSLARADLTAAQLQWHQLVETFRQDYPAYYRLNYQDVIMSSQTLQQRLGEQAAYLAYVRRGASLFILVVTRQAMEVIRQPIDSARFDGQLTALSQELYQDPILKRYKGAPYAAGLYAICIEPVRKYLAGKTRLIISRDWSFHSLPFEVLETGQQSRDYLFRKAAIAYAFSAQTFFDVRQRPASTQPVLVVAPFARSNALNAAIHRQAPTKTLRSSEAEARSIGGDLLIGPQASLSNFLRTNLARPVIYFATHAKTDDTDPTNSYIAFYPGGTPNKLNTEDIYNLPLAATGLVVLGACETGSGQTMKGEGIVSLARAVAYAGCPSVITTLWTANDETTSYLTIRLHQHLSRGMNIDQALQQARFDFFDSPLSAKYDHPYYWANYVLLGNHQPVMSAENQFSLRWWLPVALLVCFVLFRQRKQWLF